MLALALLVCEWESRTSRATWRRPGERDRRYLAALVEWGYKPSDVEQLVLTPPTQATEATADASQVDGTDLLDADSTAPEADAEDVAEATADASQVDGTDLLDADSTAPEADAEDVAGAGDEPLDQAAHWPSEHWPPGDEFSQSDDGAAAVDAAAGDAHGETRDDQAEVWS